MGWLGRCPNHPIFGSLIRARGFFITLLGPDPRGSPRARMPIIGRLGRPRQEPYPQESPEAEDVGSSAGAVETLLGVLPACVHRPRPARPQRLPGCSAPAACPWVANVPASHAHLHALACARPLPHPNHPQRQHPSGLRHFAPTITDAARHNHATVHAGPALGRPTLAPVGDRPHGWLPGARDPVLGPGKWRRSAGFLDHRGLPEHASGLHGHVRSARNLPAW